MFNWENIDTVLLDMDGTLLDLRFDSLFWLELLPIEIARKDNISLDQAKSIMKKQYNNVKGTLNWYCLDYWTLETGINIRQLKRSHAGKISLRDDAIPFLKALQEHHIQRVLLTNAHPDNLSLKLEHTELEKHLDHLYSTHTLGNCKESLALWHTLQNQHDFDPKRTLFIDDNEELLLVAKEFGIGYVLGIENPDSSLDHQRFKYCPAIHDYSFLTKQLNIKNTKK